MKGESRLEGSFSCITLHGAGLGRVRVTLISPLLVVGSAFEYSLVVTIGLWQYVFLWVQPLQAFVSRLISRDRGEKSGSRICELHEPTHSDTCST